MLYASNERAIIMKAKKNRTIKKAVKSTTPKQPRAYSYAFLTMGGRRFVELTPERFDRLLKKEQENIIRTAQYTGEDLRKLTKRDWIELQSMNEIGKKVYERAVKIARGEVTAEVEDITITNYGMGLDMMGRSDLKERFDRLARDLKANNPDEFEVFMQEVPDLFLFYKDKGKSHVKRQATFVQATAEDAIEQMEILLDIYENSGKR